MTSKLKCPVCQQDLGIILCDLEDFLCPKCGMLGTEKLWQALIQVKKDLKTATKALEEIIQDESDEWFYIAKNAIEQIKK